MPQPMPPSVHFHPDGDVFVRNGDRCYSDTPANFARDFGKEFPAMPAGAIEQIYEPSKRHAIHGPDGVMFGGDMPWEFGDEVLAQLDALLASKAERDTQEREAQADLMRRQAEETRMAQSPHAHIDLNALATQVEELTKRIEKLEQR